MSIEHDDQSEDIENISKVINSTLSNKELSTKSGSNLTKSTASKPVSRKYLTGYKNKLTGKIYYNATVQTLPSPWKYGPILRFHRDAQTVLLRDKAQQTPRDACTQVEAKYIFIRTIGDKVIKTTQNYVYADDIKREYLNKVIVLQKHIRRWLAQQELLRRKKNALLRILWEREQEKIKSKQDIKWFEDLQKRRLNPKTNDDFKLIFSDLQKWWNEEAESISKVRSGADLKAAMWLLVSVETKKIEEINKKKYTVENMKHSLDRERSLKTAAKPKVWKAYESAVQVDTGNTQRANNLYDLYITLSMKFVSPQDRVAALTNLKEILQHYHCKLTDNLKKLADREIDLLLRGVRTNLLEGLQTRIRDLFWQFAKKPLFNPEMRRSSKIKREDGSSPYILSCASCKSFYILPIHSTNEVLAKSVLENYFQKCKKCKDIENEAWIRKDFELYKRILQLLITEEEKRSTFSGLIYVLQPNDIGHLIENIWKHQSCLSSSRSDYDLEFIRYNWNKSWTPWNCLLVTRQEAATLERLDPETKYDKKFRECVSQRHSEAKRYFSNIPRFWPYITQPS